MTPHGCDLLDSTKFSATAEDLLSILVRLRELWPDALMETDKHPLIPVGDATLELIPRGPIREVFVYRTQAAHQTWQTQGWTEEGDRDLMHIIAMSDSLILMSGDNVPAEMSLWASRLAGDLKTLTTSRLPPSA